ncbi:MAG: pyridoxamine 5'-phosphate oxidase family protein [Bacteroidales bacterium]|nr:pyridoxamine 5'-phosphate oxidase family protein [Bacteroidales bacterium]
MILNNRQIHKFEEIEEIINKTDICYIALSDNNKPYILPFNFGYANKIIYLHSAIEGRKNDIIQKNNNISLCFNPEYKLFHRDEQVACSYGMRYRSVIAEGKIYTVSDFNDKVFILNIIMKKYTGKEFHYNAPSINNVAVFKVEVDNFYGKKY